MLSLYSYPALFGVADNNGYGLKVYAFLKLAGVPFMHEHIFDASKAPRGQLPYIVDSGDTVGDSETIIAYVIRKYALTIDAALSDTQRAASLFITRTLDDLYWVMSYSRWKDERYWPAFRDALKREHPQLTDEGLLKAKQYNAQRYHYQGIGRYEPDAALARGLADLEALAQVIPAQRLRARRQADQHRRRPLWLHRQHHLLRHRHAAQAFRRGAREHGAALPRHPRRGEWMSF